MIIIVKLINDSIFDKTAKNFVKYILSIPNQLNALVFLTERSIILALHILH